MRIARPMAKRDHGDGADPVWVPEAPRVGGALLTLLLAIAR
jgi:hypothetical protein